LFVQSLFTLKTTSDYVNVFQAKDSILPLPDSLWSMVNFVHLLHSLILGTLMI